MTEPEPTLGPDGEPTPDGFDFSQLRAEVADDFPQSNERRPIPSADEPKKRKSSWFGNKPAGDKADDAKPKRRSTTQKKTVPNKRGQFVAPLTQMYTAVGMAVCMRDFVCGRAIIEAAPKCAETLDELAYKNDAVRRALWSLVQTTSMGAVIAAHMPIVLAVVMHHVPAVQGIMGQMGADFADKVEEQMRADSEGGAA